MLVQVSAAPLRGLQLPDHMSESSAEDGVSPWVPATDEGDVDRVQAAGFRLAEP